MLPKWLAYPPIGLVMLSAGLLDKYRIVAIALGVAGFLWMLALIGIVIYKNYKMPEPEKCICETPSARLNNTHHSARDMEMMLLKDSDGYGIIILERNMAIACFEIDYCPKCGKDLRER